MVVLNAFVSCSILLAFCILHYVYFNFVSFYICYFFCSVLFVFCILYFVTTFCIFLYLLIFVLRFVSPLPPARASLSPNNQVSGCSAGREPFFQPLIHPATKNTNTNTNKSTNTNENTITHKNNQISGCSAVNI